MTAYDLFGHPQSSDNALASVTIARVTHRLITLFIIALSLTARAADQPSHSDAGLISAPLVTSKHGVVVSVSAPASTVGCDILKQGGNSVDAAVATAFALAVTYPEAGNIGGGGFMLVYPGGGAEPLMIDYRETAPAAATREMFASGKPNSYTLVGTPGTVRGLELAHRKFGKLPWKNLVLPAAKLAEEGFAVDAHLAAALNRVLRSSSEFPELVRVFSKPATDATWRAGDRLVQKDLAATLRQIAERGSDAFYTGDIAKQFVDDVRAGGGIITLADLASYEAKLRPAIHGTFRGYDIYSSPPPSSGGIALVESLNILENFDLAPDKRSDARTLHLMIESMRRAYCDRARWLGDSDFTKIPGELTSKDYARRLARSIDLTKATPSEQLAKASDIALSDQGSQTTHFSIIDEHGMAVANTYTLEQSWGGKIMVKGAGFLLNNEMGDFNPKPGVTTRKGLIGTAANEVAPAKRMLSSMSPTIVARDGKVVLVTGSPGGRTIINTVLCVTLNFLQFQMPPRDAVDAPRFHEPWFPDEVSVERGLLTNHATVLDELRRMGHHISAPPTTQGDAHSIWVDKDGTYIGVADQRISGAAVGY
jgi:gamma-glutamyltranspeptidase/glutathione hydrolase